MQVKEKLAVVRVTPTLAEQWLEEDEAVKKRLKGKFKNRTVIDTLVSFYASEMKAGNWKLNGESIIFGKSGVLLNGQHRLKAIIRANTAVPIVICRDFDEEVFDTIDTGRRRGGSDILSILGYANATTLASMCRWYLSITRQIQVGRPISNHQIKDCIESHPSMVHWAAMHVGKAARRVLPSGCLGVFTLMDELHGRELTEDFYHKVVTGENLTKGNPAFELRERLLAARGGRSVYLKTAAAIAITIKAANAYILGNKVGVLRYGTEESFPYLQGQGQDADLLS